jgi:hypothetical protein
MHQEKSGNLALRAYPCLQYKQLSQLTKSEPGVNVMISVINVDKKPVLYNKNNDVYEHIYVSTISVR